MEELSIKVNIADRFYPLTIEASQEETVRKAARIINDKLKELQQQFAVRDRQDMLSMIALEVATELVSLKDRNHVENEALSGELLNIQQILKEVTL